MGQAKQRGTKEERTAAAIQREADTKALKEAQRKATARVYDAAYRSGIAKPAQPISKTNAMLLASAMLSVGEMKL